MALLFFLSLPEKRAYRTLSRSSLSMVAIRARLAKPARQTSEENHRRDRRREVSSDPEELSVWWPRSSLTRRTLSLRRQPLFRSGFVPTRARPRPSCITRYFGYRSFFSSSCSPQAQDLRGPRRPRRVRVAVERGRGDEEFISAGSPKPVARRPRDVLTSTRREHDVVPRLGSLCIVRYALSLALSRSSPALFTSTAHTNTMHQRPAKLASR